MTDALARYDASIAFLRDLDDDWARLVAHVGQCLHDPKAAGGPYEALARAIGYQQLTAKGGDAIIARLKAPVPVVGRFSIRRSQRSRTKGHHHERPVQCH
jgi:3-methyladenine DNA glycosylase/8-oxoguanine DNA glycosylase